jgi:outer membrane protein OmpA-like peptidoglycan-associated protein
VWNIGDVSGAWVKGITFETVMADGWEWFHEGDMDDLDPERTGDSAKLVQGEMNEVVSSASVVFDSPVQKNMTTPEARNVLLKVAEREETRTKKFVFRPHFGTFEASLTEEDRQALDIISGLFDPAKIGRVQVTGHTDDVPISPRGQRLYADNYELSKARARSLARYLRSVWDLPSNVFVIEGKGPDKPLAPNDSVRGRTLNRRVEVNVITTTIEKRVELQPISDQNTTEIAIEGLRPGEGSIRGADPMESEGPEDTEASRPDPLKELAWFEEADGVLDWVSPDADFYPSVPAARVAVKHGPGSRMLLLINGEEADPLTFEGTITNTSKQAALSVWRGVRLTDGDNQLVAVQYSKDGRELGRIEMPIYFAGRPVKVNVIPDLSRLTADGRTPPQVAIRLTDRNGKPARPGLVGQYSVLEPYRAWEQAGSSRNEMSDTGATRGQFLIGRDGMAKLSLQPTVRSGEAVLTVDVQGDEEEVRAWLTAERKDWILVGLAEGTAGYNTVSGNMQSLEDSGGKEDFYTDGRAAFFAKGRIKGEYLLTMQYDSNGPHGASGEGLYGTIDPDRYYTLYGDSTEQDYEAPTSKKLYLKVERKQFYALFGDTSTGLTVTELARYDRRFTGFRSESKSGTFSYNIFASEEQQGFVKDEIPGDGTSGLYALSATDIVVNSESVRIETRDRFQSHVVLSVRELARHLDYNIDYDDGTLFFKAPVPERDSGFNPVYIVVDYETTDPDATGITYGGRAQAELPGSEVKVGVSHIHEDRGNGEGDLVGLDVTAELGSGLTFAAETASSSNQTSGTRTDGSAYTVELTHESLDLTGTVYLREQEAEFGLGQQMASENGMRKAGVEGEYGLTRNLYLNAEAYRQENLQTGAKRHVEELGAALDSGNTRYLTSVRLATDTDSGGTEERSEQLTAGIRWHSEDNRWDLRADHEQSIGDNNNVDFPTRTALGSDYRLTEAVSLYAEQEYTDGEETSVSSSRLGMKATPWEGGSAESTVDREQDENGERVYATTGLAQTWQVSEKWKVSAGMESAKVLKESSSEPLNGEAASVSPGEDYTAGSVGAGYAYENWDLDFRLEVREAETSDKWGVVTGLFGEPADGIGISTDLKHFETRSDSGVDTVETDIRLGFVYRPFERKWTLLDRLDLSVDDETGPAADLTGWKLVNSFNANLEASDALQVSFRLATKYVKDTVDGQEYSGTTHLLGAEGRYDITPVWDVGAWAGYLTAIDAGTTDYGLGASLGYGIVENVWISFGYNLQGFTDSDFSQGDFTAQGPFVKFRFKFDQEDLRSLLR